MVVAVEALLGEAPGPHHRHVGAVLVEGQDVAAAGGVLLDEGEEAEVPLGVAGDEVVAAEVEAARGSGGSTGSPRRSSSSQSGRRGRSRPRWRPPRRRGPRGSRAATRRRGAGCRRAGRRAPSGAGPRSRRIWSLSRPSSPPDDPDLHLVGVVVPAGHDRADVHAQGSDLPVGLSIRRGRWLGRPPRRTVGPALEVMAVARSTTERRDAPAGRGVAASSRRSGIARTAGSELVAVVDHRLEFLGVALDGQDDRPLLDAVGAGGDGRDDLAVLGQG